MTPISELNSLFICIELIFSYLEELKLRSYIPDTGQTSKNPENPEDPTDPESGTPGTRTRIPGRPESRDGTWNRNPCSWNAQNTDITEPKTQENPEFGTHPLAEEKGYSHSPMNDGGLMQWLSITRNKVNT